MGSYDDTIKLKPGLYLYTYVDFCTGKKVYVVHDDIGALEFQTSSLLLLEKWYGTVGRAKTKA